MPDFFEGLRVNDFNQPQPQAEADPNLDGTPALDAALAAAEAKATENRNAYLRSVAEFENFRKRMDRELENARKYAVERFAQELVGVGDSLVAGIAASFGGTSGLLWGPQTLHGKRTPSSLLEIPVDLVERNWVIVVLAVGVAAGFILVFGPGLTFRR